MSYADTKMQEAAEAAGKAQHTRARRPMNPRCRKPEGECAWLECLRGYRVLERDGAGPTLVAVQSMDRLWVWRRVHMEDKDKWWFELEGQQLSLPNL